MKKKKVPEQKLQHFHPPLCQACGFSGRITVGDDGSCSDPECCSPMMFVTIRCTNVNCFEYEDIHDRD